MKLLKSIATIALIAIAVTSFGQASDWGPDIYTIGKKYPGYVIKNNGDTIYGYVEAKRRASFDNISNDNQTICEFYTDPDNRKTKEKYSPDEIKEYKLADKIYRSIPYTGGLAKNKKGFVHLKEEAGISIYHYYQANDGAHRMIRGDNETWEEFDARQYGEPTVVYYTNTGCFDHSSLMIRFAKNMAILIKDHKELSEKVANKEKGYKMLQYLDIIKEYNEWYEENNN